MTELNDFLQTKALRDQGKMTSEIRRHTIFEYFTKLWNKHIFEKGPEQCAFIEIFQRNVFSKKS